MAILHSKILRDFYTASPMREGILNWYPFDKGASVIESSGGALLPLLRSRCTLVEELDNYNKGNDKFDYVVAIDPAEITVVLLKRYHSLLTQHGRLLLAFENPYGLQYFAGKPNPRTGIPFTFQHGESKKEVGNRLRLAGFKGQKWYYPFSNHYFTRELYSENYLPNEFLNNRGYVFLEDAYAKSFDERGLWKEAIRNGAFEFLCNSYLVEATVCADDTPCDVDFAAITSYREPDKAFITTIHSNGTVQKRAIYSEGMQRLMELSDNHKDLNNLDVTVLPVSFENESLIMKRLNLPTLWDYLTGRLANGELGDVELFSLFDKLRDSIYKSAKSGRCYWELVPANCFYDKDSDALIFFDQEYYWENIDPDVALVRAIYALKYSSEFQKDIRTDGWITALKNRYGLAQKWDRLAKIADAGTWKYVFGSEQTHSLDKMVRRAKSRTDERSAERKMESVKDRARFNTMRDAVAKLQLMGIKQPVIYGYGKRGKMLRYVLEANDIDPACVIDKQLHVVIGVPFFKESAEIPGDMNHDIVIITPLNEANKIAAKLRAEINCPVMTIKELANE